MKISNNILNADNLKRIISSSTIEIKQNYKGIIMIDIKFNKYLELGGYFDYLPSTYTIVKYTGGINLYNGVDYTSGFPVHLTECARKVWDDFREDMGKLLLDYIKNN